MRLPPWIVVRCFFRSLLLQASWNFERLQSLGVVYALAPALKFLYRDEALQGAYRRHLDYFNTHPYMAAPVLGTTLALESDRAAGATGGMSPEDFKGMIMAPYAAIGDALFWGALRPLAAGVALFFAAKESLWAPLVFLLVFNLPHFWLRIGGWFGGYAGRMRAVTTLQKRRLPDLALRLKETTVILLGGLGAYLTVLCFQAQEVPPVWGFALLPAVVVLGRVARRFGSSLLLIAAVVGGVLLLAQLLQR